MRRWNSSLGENGDEMLCNREREPTGGHCCRRKARRGSRCRRYGDDLFEHVFGVQRAESLQALLPVRDWKARLVRAYLSANSAAVEIARQA